MNYESWVGTVPDEIRKDSLWKISAYRLALFIADVGWHDVTKLMQDRRTMSLADQLYRALGSICANIEEGYSRGTGKDRARFYEYALGSARESRGWLYRGRYILGESVVQHRLKLLTEIIRLLLKMVPQQRTRKISDKRAAYDSKLAKQNVNPETLELASHALLQNVPLPEKQP